MHPSIQPRLPKRNHITWPSGNRWLIWFCWQLLSDSSRGSIYRHNNFTQISQLLYALNYNRPSGLVFCLIKFAKYSFAISGRPLSSSCPFHLLLFLFPSNYCSCNDIRKVKSRRERWRKYFLFRVKSWQTEEYEGLGA